MLNLFLLINYYHHDHHIKLKEIKYSEFKKKKNHSIQASQVFLLNISALLPLHPSLPLIAHYC